MRPRARRRAGAAAALPLILAMAGAAFGQTAPGPAPGGVTARIVLPPGEITVGDSVVLTLTVTHPPGTVLDDPDTASLSEASRQEGASDPAPPRLLVEEVRPVEHKPPRPGETSWTIRVRPFATGDLRLPALTLAYRLAGDDRGGTVSTEPIAIHVMSVLKSPDEEASDIRGPWWLPRAWWPWIAGALGALAVVAAVFWLRRRLRRRKPRAVPRPAAPPPVVEPPWQRAMRELEALLASGLLGQGRVKEFHVLLAEVVKRYLGAQHGFDALDRTTREVLADLARPGVDGSSVRQARVFLEACDLVKFAKYRPPSGEIDETVGAARALIASGRPAPGGQKDGVAA